MAASFEYHSPPTSERWAPLYAMAKNSICISAFNFYISSNIGGCTLGIKWKITADPDILLPI